MSDETHVNPNRGHDMFLKLNPADGRRVRALAGVVMALATSACASTPGNPVEPPPKPAGPESGATASGKPERKPSIATSPDGTKIAYETSGTGPALLLLHGGGQTRTSWNDGGYVERLSKRFTVITIDQRGVGDSDRPATADAYALDRVLADLLAVADAAGAKRFHLWGYGHGASVGRYLAARSDRVISAVLVGTTLGPAITGIVKEAVVAMRAKWLPLLQAKQAGTLDLSTLSPGDRATLDGGTPIVALSLGALVDYPPLEPADIKAPALWLVGGADTAAMENVKAYEGKLAGTSVTLKVLGSASYSDCFTKIDEALAAVEPFLAGAAGPS
jgi:pimeloyl-ACP methyl ester carboxylesterase